MYLKKIRIAAMFNCFSHVTLVSRNECSKGFNFDVNNGVFSSMINLSPSFAQDTIGACGGDSVLLDAWSITNWANIITTCMYSIVLNSILVISRVIFPWQLYF
ncbi:hypothetical protein N9K77_01500 [bacterium]|nr:hypothetical protein [bacterium]